MPRILSVLLVLILTATAGAFPAPQAPRPLQAPPEQKAKATKQAPVKVPVVRTRLAPRVCVDNGCVCGCAQGRPCTCGNEGGEMVRVRVCESGVCPVEQPEVRVKVKDRTPSATDYRVRVLILRHSPDPIAIMDANLVKEAVSDARESGLDAKVIGDVDATRMSLADVRREVEKACKECGEKTTLIIHTIGHGWPTGQIQNLGERRGVLGVLARVASSKRQRMIWWQLSCFAKAGMPDSTGSNHLLVVCSSPEGRTSGVDNQGIIIAKLLDALARGSRDLDANGDGVITSRELVSFLNGLSPWLRRGDLVTGNCDPFVCGKGQPPARTTPAKVIPTRVAPARAAPARGRGCGG